MDITSLILANPKASILVISFLATLFVTIISHFLTDKEKMRGIKAKQKSLREEMKKHKDNPTKIMELQSEALKITGTMMKSSFKPLIATFVPFLILLYWLRATYTSVLGNSWIWWYIISSIISSLVFRKVLDIA